MDTGLLQWPPRPRCLCGSRRQVTMETRRYRVVFNEAVTGLTVGSLVQYNGLRVGEARQLQLDPEDPRRVLADMEVNAATPINQVTRARLAIANITGAANILLSTDNPAAIPLEKGEAGLPVLYAEPSAIGEGSQLGGQRQWQSVEQVQQAFGVH